MAEYLLISDCGSLGKSDIRFTYGVWYSEKRNTSARWELTHWRGDKPTKGTSLSVAECYALRDILIAQFPLDDKDACGGAQYIE